MRKQSIIILSLIVIGTLFGVGYASSTSISDSGIITPSLTVNGQQLGEPTFTNYNTIQLNATVGAGSADVFFGPIVINNNGDVLYTGDTHTLLLTKAGVKKFENASMGVETTHTVTQSMTGKYQVAEHVSSILRISVFNNDNYIQTLGFNTAQILSPTDSTKHAIAISPDGHYIAIIGKDSGGADDRLVIFKGS